MMKTKTVLLALLFSVSLLAGWGGSAVADTTLTGKYTMVAMLDENGKEALNFRELAKEAGLNADANYLEFLSGGKVKMVSGLNEGAPETMEGTFTQNGKSIEVNFEDEALKGTIDGKKITLKDKEGVGMLLEKQ